MKKLFLLLLFVAIVASLYYYAIYSPLRISSEEAKKAIQNGVFPIVLDVRTDLEYKMGHYPGSLHIPTSMLADTVEKSIPDKTKGILIYCNTGQRARHAADILKGKGYRNVRYISGLYLSLL